MGKLKDTIKNEYKAEIVGVFHSFAREEEGEKSDVNILVKFQDGATLFDMVSLSDFLEKKLGTAKFTDLNHFIP